MAIDYSDNMPHEDDGASDASSDVTELEANDFPDHFSERDGRLFHSHGTLPYPLPVDAYEQGRLNNLHNIFRDTVGLHYVGPVAEILNDGMQKRVLDLGTGTGIWPMDMARLFPRVKIYGVDIGELADPRIRTIANYPSLVPIATRQPEPNVQFEIHDITQRFRWRDGVMDFIHARNIDLAVPSYPTLLQDVARLLRPGGIFFSGEIGRSIEFAHNFSSDPIHQVPRARRFYDVVNHSLALRHLNLIADRIPSFIRHSQQFTVPIIQTFHIPIGDWHRDSIMRRVGKKYLATLRVFAENLTPMLRETGMTHHEVDALVTGFIDDIENVRGLVGVYHTVWARKL